MRQEMVNMRQEVTMRQMYLKLPVRVCPLDPILYLLNREQGRGLLVILLKVSDTYKLDHFLA